MAIFIVPALAAAVLYLWFPFKGNEDSLSVGELMYPPLSLAPFSGVSRDGQSVPEDFFTRKWTLFYLAGEDCDLRCQSNLFKTRQLHRLLGKDMHRVKTVYLSMNIPEAFFVGEPGTRYRNLEVVIASESMEKVLGNLPEQRLYIVDPHGNIVMRYLPNVVSKGVLRDLKRLLRASRIG